MAKKKAKSSINKSQAIRDYLAKKPKAAPKEVIAALKENGVEVSVGLVSNVKYSKKRPKKAVKKKVSVKTVAARRLAVASLSVADLLEVKKLADQMGGVKTVRQALDTLEQLSG